MASASVAGTSKQSKSDPNRGDGPLATAPSDPNSESGSFSLMRNGTNPDSPISIRSIFPANHTDSENDGSSESNETSPRFSIFPANHTDSENDGSSESNQSTLLPAPLSQYESQKRRDWNTFGQYLRNQTPPITLAGCRGNHVIDFLRYLDQFGKTKVHTTGCPFYGYPEPPAPCPCPLRQAWGSLDALIGRLGSAYEEDGGRPESNPFAGRAVRVYLREFRYHQAKARGIPYKKRARKRPTTVTDKTVVASKGQGGNATGSGGDGSGSAAQTTFTGV